MPSLEGWDLERYRRLLRRRAEELRVHPGVAVRVDVSDLVQATFEQALRPEAPACTGDSDAQRLGWLQAIQDNLLVDMHRRHFAQKRDIRREQDLQRLRQALQQTTVSLDGVLAGREPTPSENVAGAEATTRLSEAIAKLPPRERDAATLRFVEQLAVAEIAQRMNVSVGAATGLIARAAKRLKDLLEGFGE